MNELVFVQNDEVVTDSLMIAETFTKEHAKVKRDIENLECSKEFNAANFGAIGYTDSRGRQQVKYIITRDGFSFLVMGYTGKKAAEFKEKYIAGFRMLENHIKQPRVLSETEQLKASMKLSLETSEELGEIKTKVSSLEERFDNELTLNHGQAVVLSHAIKKRIERLHASGLMGTLETKRQMYSNIHGQLRRAFRSPTYREIKRTDFDDAIKWIEAWRPL